MPCDEQGVWIGPRSDNVEDAGAALKRFEDELAEFERLGEARWAATDNSAHVKVSLFLQSWYLRAAEADQTL